jgi:hypothetical protein
MSSAAAGTYSSRAITAPFSCPWNVILSALYSEGGKTYARMYEYQGRSGTAEVRYLRGGARLKEVDLMGNGDKEVPESLSFHPWQIRTFRVVPSK